jgi:ribosomal-protein-alanine N-acetyltransferase
MSNYFYNIRPIQEDDIEQISEIDREAFPGESMFRPFSLYKSEIRNSSVHYIVACLNSESKKRKDDRISYARQFIEDIKSVFTGDSGNSIEEENGSNYVVGFVGLWNMLQEAHITAIATRSAFRNRGIGEALLINAIEYAINANSDIVTLEVRVSNEIAQKLYKKYGFHVVGRRPRYYSDNNEDALLMSTDTLSSSEFKTNFDMVRDIHQNNVIKR